MIRYILRNIYFTAHDISRNIVKALFSSFGIMFLIAFTVLYLSLREGVKQYIGENLFGKLAINEIIINPAAAKKTGAFTYGEQSGNIISWRQYNNVRNMSEVSSVQRIAVMNYTSRLRVSMLGKSQTRRIPVYAADRSFFRGRIDNWKAFSDRYPLPIILPQFGLQLLNNYASQIGLPQFAPKTLRGLPGTILVTTANENSKDEKRLPISATLHAVTGDLDVPGLIVPMDFITSFEKKNSVSRPGGGSGYSYIRLYAEVKDIKKLPEVTARIKKLGLDVESQSDVSDKTNRAMSIIDGMSIAVGAVLLLLTVISIFNSYLVIVYNRTYDISLKRVIGVSKFRIVLSFLFEAALIGAVHGSAGYFAGLKLTSFFSSTLGEWVPSLKEIVLKPQAEGLFVYAAILSIGISMASAFLPALFASNKNLFKSIGK